MSQSRRVEVDPALGFTGFELQALTSGLGEGVKSSKLSGSKRDRIGSRLGETMRHNIKILQLRSDCIPTARQNRANRRISLTETLT